MMMMKMHYLFPYSNHIAIGTFQNAPDKNNIQESAVNVDLF